MYDLVILILAGAKSTSRHPPGEHGVIDTFTGIHTYHPQTDAITYEQTNPTVLQQFYVELCRFYCIIYYIFDEYN